MRLDNYDKEQQILNVLERKGVYLTAREIAESIYGKGKHQSIVFSKLEDMVRDRKLIKAGVQQPYSYRIPTCTITRHQDETPKIASQLFNPSNILLDRNVLFEKANAYHSLIQSDSHARYLSWEHCYCYFYENHSFASSNTKDFACLHLAWYLASWGMLRNSFLMQKDYRIHMDVIEIIFSKEYSSLFGASIDSVNEIEDFINIVFSLSDCIRRAYLPFARECNAEVSDTLITKVLLGTLGCVPAYDRFFKYGLKATGIATPNFTKDSIRSLAGYYNLNRALFGDISFKINQKIDYTPMKILDMCFWQIGYESSKEEAY